MKKIAIATALMAATGPANAVLVNDSILNIGEVFVSLNERCCCLPLELKLLNTVLLSR